MDEEIWIAIRTNEKTINTDSHELKSIIIERGPEFNIRHTEIELHVFLHLQKKVIMIIYILNIHKYSFNKTLY